MRRVALTAAVFAVAVPSSAWALAPTSTGWWWRAQTGVVVEVPAPPQVPEGGLYVEGAPGGPTAVAAVRFTLGEGQAADVLTLRTADEQGGEQAVLLACPPESSWVPASGGSWSTRPEPRCEDTAIPGKRAEDGSAWVFDLALLPSARVVDLVLTPGTVEGRPEGAAGSVFAVAFERPGADALSVTQDEPGGADADQGVDEGVGQGQGDVSSTPPGMPPVVQHVPPPPVSGGAPLSGEPQPEAAPPGAADPSVITPTVSGERPAGDSGAARDGRDARALATLVALLSVGVAGVLSRDRAVALPGSDVAAEERLGGIGRFRRPRSSAPPPL
jgi:hypothetical protein